MILTSYFTSLIGRCLQIQIWRRRRGLCHCFPVTDLDVADDRYKHNLEILIITFEIQKVPHITYHINLYDFHYRSGAMEFSVDAHVAFWSQAEVFLLEKQDKKDLRCAESFFRVIFAISFISERECCRLINLTYCVIIYVQSLGVKMTKIYKN